MKKLLIVTILSVSTLFVSPTYASESVAKACNQREAGAEAGKFFGFGFGLGARILACATFAWTGPIGVATCEASVIIGSTITFSTIGEEVGGQIDGCGGPISNRLMTPGQ